jgi:hypothetical protein
MHGRVCYCTALKIVRSAVGEIQMVVERKRETRQDYNNRDKRERQEKALDEALKNTFPASDPVSAEQPTAPALREGAGARCRAAQLGQGYHVIRATETCDHADLSE